MKKLLLVCTVTLFSISFCFAQPPFAEGTWAIGGNLGFSTTGGDAQEVTSFSFGPQVCNAIKENLFLGVQLQYSSTNQKDDFKESSFGGNVMVESFPSPLSGNVGGLYFGGGVGYSTITIKDESSNPSPDIDLNEFDVFIDYGAWFNIAKNFKMKAAMGALSYSSISDDDFSASVISLNVNPLSNLDFTLKYMIPPSE